MILMILNKKKKEMVLVPYKKYLRIAKRSIVNVFSSNNNSVTEMKLNCRIISLIVLKL